MHSHANPHSACNPGPARAQAGAHTSAHACARTCKRTRTCKRIHAQAERDALLALHGKATKAQFKNAMMHAFKEIDADHSGYLTWDEFEAYAAS